MNQIPISPNIWKLAQAILTQKQMVVLELREKRGFSWNQLAVNFNCTRANVREIHRAATKNLLDAIEAAGGIDEALEFAQPRPSPEEKERDDAVPSHEESRLSEEPAVGGRQQGNESSSRLSSERGEGAAAHASAIRERLRRAPDLG